MGYSPEHNKIFVYYKFANGEISKVPIENIDHVASSYFALYLGIDFDGTKSYPALDAKFSHWHIALGKGAYSEIDDDMEKF